MDAISSCRELCLVSLLELLGVHVSVSFSCSELSCGMVDAMPLDKDSELLVVVSLVFP